MNKLLDLLNSLELYEDSSKTSDLAKQIHDLFSNIVYPYRDFENIPDSTKGDCPDCSAGLLSVDLDDSFVVTIYGRTFSFDVIVCDMCKYVRIEKLLAESDSLEIESD